MKTESTNEGGAVLVGDLAIQDRTIYTLNKNGENKWWATVFPGFHDNGIRVSDDECRAVAACLAKRAALPASQEQCSGPLCGLPEFGGNCHPLCKRDRQEHAGDKHDKELTEALKDRDTYHEWADELADAIAKHTGHDIGEHSSDNNPWRMALNALECHQQASQEQAQQPSTWTDGTRPPFDAGPMTASKAAYFMERFKREEKLLGPNEQRAIDFVLAMLAAPRQQAGGEPEPWAEKARRIQDVLHGRQQAGGEVPEDVQRLLTDAKEALNELLTPVVADDNREGYDARDVRRWQHTLERLTAAQAKGAQA